MQLRLLALGCALAVSASATPVCAQTSPPPDPPTFPHDTGPADDASGEPDDWTAPTPPRSDATLGAQWFWVEGKAMPGLTLRAGKGLWWATFETSLVWLTERDPGRSSFLGSQLGGFFSVRPLHTRRLELDAGLGVDAYPLWNIHGDEWQVALALRGSGHFRITRNVGLFATARVYPIATRGLELGVRRDGSTGLPVLFSTGIECWL